MSTDTINAIMGGDEESVRIIKQTNDGTLNHNYVTGGAVGRGKFRWLDTNVADSDATQAASILAQIVL